MRGNGSGPGDLGFWSFVDYAVDRTAERMPGIDPLAMRMVMTLHRAASMIVYDIESSVHRPRGWSWPGPAADVALFRSPNVFVENPDSRGQ